MPAYFASSVKIDWSADANVLQILAKGVRQATLDELDKDGISDVPSPSNQAADSLRKLKPEQERLLLTNSISPLPLHKSLVLREQIDRFENSRFHKYFRLALANALVYRISNLRFGPEVGLGTIKQDVSVVESWFEEITKICEDLRFAENGNFAESKAFFSDSRNPMELIGGERISAVITSPPYPNEKDYTRTTRLESVVLGFINSKEELRALKKSLLRSNTRNVYKGDADDDFVTHVTEVQRIASDIENRRLELGKTSGFERMYPRVTKLYFGGIAKHLAVLRPILRKNAHLAYVVGDQASYLQVMIRTGKIIGDIAKSLGYELIKIDLFRTRFSTATRSELNEEVVVLRWPE